MGNADRGIRLLFVLVIAVLFLTNQITGLAAMVLGIFVAAFLFCGIIGFCPLYTVLKMSILKK